jgi:hypothetical protein
MKIKEEKLKYKQKIKKWIINQIIWTNIKIFIIDNSYSDKNSSLL